MFLQDFEQLLQRPGYKSNEDVPDRITSVSGPHDDLLCAIRCKKLRWYGHVSISEGLAKTILRGTVQGGRDRGRQKKQSEDDIKE